MSLPPTLSDFDFELPPELIAQHPAAERSASRLLDGAARAPVEPRVPRAAGSAASRATCWSFNDTASSGRGCYGAQGQRRAVEALVETRVAAPRGAGASAREQVAEGGSRHRRLADAFDAEVLRPRRVPDAGSFHLRFPADPHALLERHGKCRCRRTSRTARQQPTTASATRPCSRARRGAVAAPTAALHFDADGAGALAPRGVGTASVTLHVGAGTFQPVRTETLVRHRMHSEWFEVPAPPSRRSRAARRRRPRRRGRHDHAARARVGGAARRSLRAGARDRLFITARASLPRRRPAGHQLPPAQEHADDAGQRLRGSRA
jgi:S-adenosylmethionine:tRNA ribosyltransferase-isomerase